jgi:hypothetical protein
VIVSRPSPANGAVGDGAVVGGDWVPADAAADGAVEAGAVDEVVPGPTAGTDVTEVSGRASPPQAATPQTTATRNDTRFTAREHIAPAR